MRPSVLMIGSEAVPFAKTGGLADVLGALPPALGAAGLGRHGGVAAVPRRRGGDARRARSGQRWRLHARSRAVSTRRWTTARAPCSSSAPTSTIAIRCTRSGGEEYPDNARRFAVLVRAALELRRAPRSAPRGRPRARLAGRARAGLPDARSSHRIRCSAACRRSSRSTTSPIRGCSKPTGCRASIWAGPSSTSIGWSSGAASAS